MAEVPGDGFVSVVFVPEETGRVINVLVGKTTGLEVRGAGPRATLSGPCEVPNLSWLPSGEQDRDSQPGKGRGQGWGWAGVTERLRTQWRVWSRHKKASFLLHGSPKLALLPLSCLPPTPTASLPF